MKKLPLFIIACLLISVITWAGWSKPTFDSKLRPIVAKQSPTICCSADGKTIYLSCVSSTPPFDPSLSAVGHKKEDNGYTEVILYKSVDGGETWTQQTFSPGLNPAK